MPLRTGWHYYCDQDGCIGKLLIDKSGRAEEKRGKSAFNKPNRPLSTPGGRDEDQSLSSCPTTKQRRVSVEERSNRAHLTVAEPQSLVSSVQAEKRGIRWACRAWKSPPCTPDSIAYCRATLHVICGPRCWSPMQGLTSLPIATGPDHRSPVRLKPIASSALPIQPKRCVALGRLCMPRQVSLLDTSKTIQIGM